MTQGQLAGQELSAAEVSAIETGRLVPSPRTVRVLARKLGSSPEYVLYGITDDQMDALHTDVAAARYALYQGQPHEAILRFEHVISDPILQELPELRNDAIVEWALAWEATGDLTTAASTLETMAATATVPGERAWSELIATAVRCHYRAGDNHRAVEVGRAALTELNDLRGRWGRAGIVIAVDLLQVYVDAGHESSGKRLANNLRDRLSFSSANDPALHYKAHWHLAEAARTWGPLHYLLRHAEDAVSTVLKHGDGAIDPRQTAIAYADLLLGAHAPEAARRARRALSTATLAWEQRPARIDAQRRLLLARAHRQLGDHDQAIEALSPILAGPEADLRPQLRGQLLVQLGHAYADTGRPATALFQKAAELLAEGGLSAESDEAAELARAHSDHATANKSQQTQGGGAILARDFPKASEDSLRPRPRRRWQPPWPQPRTSHPRRS